ncbi:response regulator [Leptolyngbya sp. FACHB-36]|uniref:response regulator n=1 Tax=Leptolyngbya sp. FACHB-36 TaxID=2692808 RepID=UPI0016813F38|nr:response regulator [Leptolyngbya sp. FACHB-36]
MASHKILVIDDSNVIRNMVRDMLPKGNFEVLEAKDGVQGLNLIRQERPNLIMLDFLLPRLSGWEVYQQIQTQQDLQAIPLVLMSGRKEEVTEKLQEPFEYFEFVQKPFDQKELIDAIKAAMAKSKRRPISAPAAAAVPAAAVPVAAAPAESGASSTEVQALKDKVAKMQAEIDGLKKQMSQILTFIKQKLR